MFSLIIPTFNEEASIGETVRTAHETLTGAGEEFEILVINDGSTDGTAARLSEMQLPNLIVIAHPRNTGYSASIKTGIRRAKGEVLGITDADGTYPIGQFPHLLHVMREGNLDMVIGARVKKGVKIPPIRRPAKFIVNKLANMLTGMRIPDLNSGMRIFTKEFALRFMHIYPQRFSFTITTTLAALTNDYLVEFVPIEYFKRQGKSSLSSGMNGVGNFVGFLGLIIRITTYFRPMRFFLIPSVFLVLIGIGAISYTLWNEANISDAGMLMLLTGFQIGLFGMLAEIVVRYRNSEK
ncbi:MAG: glycosyltransferase family 2 protein [Candidatus Peribacteraceae bacterium]|nr:glycosyltransferase family 2 protein [Candidatus Peribacteraceae bacterium]